MENAIATFLKPTLPKLALFVILGGYFTLFSSSGVTTLCFPQCIEGSPCPPVGFKCPQLLGFPLPTHDDGDFGGLLVGRNMAFALVDFALWYLVSCILIFAYEKITKK